MKKAFQTIVGLLLGTALCTPITCPVLKCEEQDLSKPVKQDLCYVHDQQQPVQTIRMHTCEWYQNWDQTTMLGPVACEFDLLSGRWAWIDEPNQQWGGKGYETSTNVDNSELNHKLTKAYCRYVTDFQINLNNGRSCTNPWECVSMNCKNGVCKGLTSGDFCNSHADCDAQ